MLKIVIPLALPASNDSASSENCGICLPFSIAAFAVAWASSPPPPPPAVVLAEPDDDALSLLSSLPHALTAKAIEHATPSVARAYRALTFPLTSPSSSGRGDPRPAVVPDVG